MTASGPRPVALAAVLALGAMIAACDRAASGPPSAPAPAPPPAPAPDRDATAGTDLCPHGVADALCPQCHPALAAVYRARGDWCAEHALPESFCPICHPERGGRPARADRQHGEDAESDPGPPDGIRVRLASSRLAGVVGLETAPVERAPEVQTIEALATLSYDARKVAHLNPRAPGVVRTLAVDVGTSVVAGELLATIESAAVGQGRARLDTARARLALAQKDLSRVTSLAATGLHSERELAEARRAVLEARAEVGAATADTSLMGSTEGPSYRVEAPIAGVVTRRAGSIGAFVETDLVLFEIVDVSALWVDLEVPEREAPLIREGLEVRLLIDGLPGETFTTRVDYLAPEVSPERRSVLARAALDNRDRRLRAHMTGRATLLVPREAGTAVRVPRQAIQSAKKVELVFVPVAPDLYEGRRVKLERSHPDGTVEVQGRLAVGERVVTEGAFLLKTETLKDSIGAGCCADEGPR